MAHVTMNTEPIVDTGTKTYDNPKIGITYELAHSTESTGAVKGPPKEVTYNSEDYGEPTGVSPNPATDVTYEQWPGAPKPKQAAAKPDTDAVSKSTKKGK